MSQITLPNGCSVRWDAYYKVYKVSSPSCTDVKQFKRNEKQLAITYATNLK